MPKTLQEEIEKLNALKLEKKEADAFIQSVLEQSSPYQALKEKIAPLKKELDTVKSEVLAGHQDATEKVDGLNSAIKDQQQLLSDLVVNQLMAGNGGAVEIPDLGIVWRPVIRVKFEKEQLKLPV